MSVFDEQLNLYREILSKLIYSENYFTKEEKEALLQLVQHEMVKLDKSINYAREWERIIERSIKWEETHETAADHR